MILYKSGLSIFISVPLRAQLIEYVGPSTNTIGNLTTAVCRSLFTGPVESYNNSCCQCKNETFINDNNNGCCKNNIKIF